MKLTTVALALLLAAAASAAPLCVSGTISSYENMPVGCAIGSLTFSDFNFVAVGSAGISPDQIHVSVQDTDNRPSFVFSGPFSASSGLWLGDFISFLVVAPTITTTTFTLNNPKTSNGSSVTGSSSVCSSVNCVSADVESASYISSSGTQASSTPSAAGTLQVNDAIIAQGSSTAASVDSVTTSFSSTAMASSTAVAPQVVWTPAVQVADAILPADPPAVPEPNANLLMGSGLVLCALLLKFSRKRARN